MNVPRQNRRRFISWGFEVTADLKNDVTTCTEGQFVRADQAVNGIAQRGGLVRGNPKANHEHRFKDDQGNETVKVQTIREKLPVPPKKSGLWGGDNYDTEVDNPWKRHVARQIRWVDSPGIIYNGQLPWHLESDAEFLSFVDGPLGQCWCQFTIDWKFAYIRNAAGNWVPNFAPGGLNRVAGLNCTVDARHQ